MLQHRRRLNALAQRRGLLVAAVLLLLGAHGAPSRPAEGWVTPEPPRALIVERGRVTARLRDVPLDQFLNELARETGVVIAVRGTRPRTVTADVTDLSLHAALARALPGCHVAAVYSSHEAIWPSNVWLECGRSSETTLESLEVRAESERELKLFGHIPQQLELIDAIAEGTDRQAVDLLSAIAQTESDEEVRVAAVRALGRIGESAALNALALALRSDSVPVRVTALEGLAATKSLEAVPFVRQALSDLEMAVREKAEEALAALGHPMPPETVSDPPMFKEDDSSH